MRKSLLILIAMGFTTFAQAYSIEMTCGQLVKAKNGKILSRLEPGFFGINQKYVLMTKFNNPIGYVIKGTTDGTYIETHSKADTKTYTHFRRKSWFQSEKVKAQKAIKESKSSNTDLYACAGNIDVAFRYSAGHVYLSNESIDKAKKKMVKQGLSHAWKAQ
jgi:hypothetical protein